MDNTFYKEDSQCSCVVLLTSHHSVSMLISVFVWSLTVSQVTSECLEVDLEYEGGREVSLTSQPCVGGVDGRSEVLKLWLQLSHWLVGNLHSHFICTSPRVLQSPVAGHGLLSLSHIRLTTLALVRDRLIN